MGPRAPGAPVAFFRFEARLDFGARTQRGLTWSRANGIAVDSVYQEVRVRAMPTGLTLSPLS